MKTKMHEPRQISIGVATANTMIGLFAANMNVFQAGDSLHLDQAWTAGAATYHVAIVNGQIYNPHLPISPN
jgi:hypothetical protein